MAEKSRDKYIRLSPLPIPHSSVGTLHAMSLLLTLRDIRGGFPIPEKDFLSKHYLGQTHRPISTSV